MVVFQSALIRLDYEPSTDILAVEMPDVDSVTISEIERLLSVIVDNVRNYDVKNLLIDARKTQVNVDEQSYTSMMSGFLRDLLSTRLQKLARIVSNSKVRENVVKKVYGEKQLSVALQSFIDIPSAKYWLNQKV